MGCLMEMCIHKGFICLKNRIKLKKKKKTIHCIWVFILMDMSPPILLCQWELLSLCITAHVLWNVKVCLIDKDTVTWRMVVHMFSSTSSHVQVHLQLQHPNQLYSILTFRVYVYNDTK